MGPIHQIVPEPEPDWVSRTTIHSFSQFRSLDGELRFYEEALYSSWNIPAIHPLTLTSITVNETYVERSFQFNSTRCPCTTYYGAGGGKPE